jgi:prevent-host-death family protein
MLTQTVDVYEAQNRLLELLGTVMTGEEVMLTKGNQPIARLVPIKPSAALRRASQVSTWARSPRARVLMSRCRMASGWGMYEVVVRHARVHLMGQ